MIRSRAGFTLIELMVVIFILALLAMMVAPRIMGRTDEAKRTAAMVQIKNLEQALNLYKLDNGIYPSTEQGLDALANKPTIGDIPNKWTSGGYMKRVPMDPWGREYVYLSPGADGDYSISSYGADGVEGGDEIAADINNWEMG